jgi:hypothetical protein
MCTQAGLMFGDSSIRGSLTFETPYSFDGLNVSQLRSTSKKPDAIVEKIIHLLHHSFDEAWVVWPIHCLTVKLCIVIHQRSRERARRWTIGCTILELVHELMVSHLQGNK